MNSCRRFRALPVFEACAMSNRLIICFCGKKNWFHNFLTVLTFRREDTNRVIKYNIKPLFFLFQLNDYHNAFRHSIAALRRTTDNFRGPLREKRSQKYENFVQYPSREVEITPHLGFDRIPFNDYNRIVSALKGAVIVSNLTL